MKAHVGFLVRYFLSLRGLLHWNFLQETQALPELLSKHAD
jgi:hypothetical protein